MPEKGPPVFLDYDQAALDAAYDQAAYAPNREQLIQRRIRDSELARRRISGLLIITDPGPVVTTPPLLAVSASKAARKCSGTRSGVSMGVRAITLLLVLRTRTVEIIRRLDCRPHPRFVYTGRRDVITS